MEKTAIVFLILLTVLLLGQWLYTESFVDVSDNSGTMIKMSLSDLMAILTSKSSSSRDYKSDRNKHTIISTTGTLDATTYNTLLSDIKKTVQDELLSNAQEGGLLSGAGSQGGGNQILTDSCIDSFSAQQGSDFMRYIPGKNPNDYIRKDSIPCYGCNL